MHHIWKRSVKTLTRPGRYFSTPGLLLGTLFMAVSLTPTLLPRQDVVQGLISGLSLVAGYGVAVAAHGLWLYLGLPRFKARTRQLIKLVATGLCVLVALIFLWQATQWQNGVRALMDMEAEAGLSFLVIGAVALLVFLVLILLAKLFRHTFRWLSHRLQRFIPRRIAYVAGSLAALLLFWSAIDGIVFSMALRAADSSYQQIDALIEPGTEQPLAQESPGSEASLLAWDELGRQGRRYLTFAPRADDIEAVMDGEAQDALRVYVGMNSAPTPEERAQLALQELERVGGFDRSMLVLVTPTGTGWIDPAAMEPLEYLQLGDIASVSAQYSYLPSPLSLTLEGEYGQEMARALFEVIYEHWTALPADNRPDLYLHGLSLGALNSDRSFELFDIIDDPFQGALWSGPPFRSETWQSVTQRRDQGSPAWLPRYRSGSVVRFANQHQRLSDTPGEWGDFRIGYLQYASDPVTFFDPASFYREPDWMGDPRGPDVSDDLRWMPIVTMLQLAADMGFGSSPKGYGHDYSALHYLDAWIDLTEPDHLDEAAIERLRAVYRDEPTSLLEQDGEP